METLVKEEVEIAEIAEEKNPEKKKKSKYWRITAIIFSITVILALLSFITPFCDWYVNNVYIYLSDGLSCITACILE